MASALDMVAGVGQYGFDPLGDFIAGREGRNRLNAMKREEQARPLMGQALQGDKNALRGLAGIDPQGFMDVSKFQAGQENVKAQDAAAQAEKVAAALYRADTPEKWAATINYLKQTGHEISPEEENFANKDAVLGEFMSLKDQMAQGNSDRYFGLQQQQENRLAAEANKPTAAETPKFGVIGEDQFGKKIYGYPPAPGEAPNPNASGAVPVPQPIAPNGQQPAEAPNVMDLHGEEFISQLDPKIANQVRAIIEGRAPYPTGMLLKTPYGQQLAAYVTQADPTFESANATARAKIQADYSTGTIAKTNNALNTAIKHMRQMSDAVDALDNYDAGDMGVFTTTANLVKNAYLTNSGDPRVTDFKSISGKVAEELTRAYRGAGGAEADINRELEVLQAANSPTQLHSAIAKMAELLRSKIEANEAQYQSVMGPLVKPRPMISKEAQEALDVISGRAEGGDKSQQPITEEEYNSLPSGTQFLAPDGTRRVKP